MPVNKAYCKSTSIKKMGFSQRSTCKALGVIPRTSKAQYGQYIVSDKYKRKSRSKSKTRSKSKRN